MFLNSQIVTQITHYKLYYLKQKYIINRTISEMRIARFGIRKH